MATFTARDLALVLPDSAGDVDSLRHTGGAEETITFEPLKPKIDTSKKVIRYFPGKAPVWINEDGLEAPSASASSASSSGVSDVKPIVVDRRLARLAAAGSNVASSEVKPTGRRRVYEAEVVIENNDDDNDDNDANDDDGYIEKLNREPSSRDADSDDDVIARRNRVRQRLAALEEQAKLDSTTASTERNERKFTGNKVVEESSESEYETETDESSEDERVIMKPVFVPKHKRDTIKDAAAIREEELQKEMLANAKLQHRKQQTKEFLADSLRRKEEEKAMALEGTDNDSDAGLPDDSDNLDDEIEFENWKLREIKRLKREAEVREQLALEKADLIRRRNMTEEERRKEDEASGRFAEKEKPKWKFLQKYYHKGVFYMDDDSLATDDIRKRDFSGATLEDKFDRESLPAVLQVKKFGMRGRTKYTHLLDQDTTRLQKPGDALRPDQRLLQQYVGKRAGVHGSLDEAGRVAKKSKM